MTTKLAYILILFYNVINFLYFGGYMDIDKIGFSSTILENTDKIDSPTTFLGFLDEEFSEIFRTLDLYPSIRSEVNLEAIKFKVKESAHSQFSKNLPDATRKPIFIRRGDKFTDIKWEALNDQQRRDMSVFKAKYLKWASNLIKKINGIKMRNKWSWLNVKEVVTPLTSLSKEA